MQQHHQRGQENSDRQASFNVLYVLASGWAWCFLPFLRWNIGSEGIGIRGLIAVVVMWGYCAFARCPEIVQFFWIWLIAVILQRLRTASLAGRGVVMHSRYTGDSIIKKLLPGIRKVGAAHFLEVVLCFLTGGLLMRMSESFGKFVLIGSFAMAVVLAIDQQVIKNRVRAMRDAESEQRFLADLLRGRRDDF